MAVSDLVDLSGLMDDAKCFAFVRQHLSTADRPWISRTCRAVVAGLGEHIGGT